MIAQKAKSDYQMEGLGSVIFVKTSNPPLWFIPRGGHLLFLFDFGVFCTFRTLERIKRNNHSAFGQIALASVCRPRRRLHSIFAGCPSWVWVCIRHTVIQIQNMSFGRSLAEVKGAWYCSKTVQKTSKNIKTLKNNGFARFPQISRFLIHFLELRH